MKKGFCTKCGNVIRFYPEDGELSPCCSARMVRNRKQLSALVLGNCVDGLISSIIDSIPDSSDTASLTSNREQLAKLAYALEDVESILNNIFKNDMRDINID